MGSAAQAPGWRLPCSPQPWGSTQATAGGAWGRVLGSREALSTQTGPLASWSPTPGPISTHSLSVLLTFFLVTCQIPAPLSPQQGQTTEPHRAVAGFSGSPCITSLPPYPTATQHPLLICLHACAALPHTSTHRHTCLLPVHTGRHTPVHMRHTCTHRHHLTSPHTHICTHRPTHTCPQYTHTSHSHRHTSHTDTTLPPHTDTSVHRTTPVLNFSHPY